MQTTIPQPVTNRLTSRTTFLMRTAAGIALAVASAAMLMLAFPPYDLWPLIWVGFVPMLVAQHRIMPRRLSSLASAIGVGGFLGGYLGNAFLPFANVAWYMKALPLLIGLMILILDWGKRAMHERTGYRWFVLSGVLGWVGFEMIRSFIPMMGTWAFVGYALYAQPWLIQPVSIFGIFGMDVLIMAANIAAAQLALAALDRRWRLDADLAPVSSRQARHWLVGVGGALLAWVGLSLALLHDPAPSVRVAAIQPDTTELFSGAIQALSPERQEQVRIQLWPRLQEQTRQAAQQGARFIVWPEALLTYDPQVEHSAELRALAAETQAYLAVGYSVQTPDGQRNEVTVLSPEGQFLGVFGKDHPVVFAGERNTATGVYPTYASPWGVLGAIICYDLDFTDTARNVVANGAQLLAVPSGDWWEIADKHYTHVVFRAIENRVAMVKPAPSFGSAIIDPYGRILARSVEMGGTQATLVSDLPLVNGGAPVTQLGDWVGWVCLVGLVGFAALEGISKRRAGNLAVGR